MITAVIIDDEPYARNELQELCQDIEQLTVIGEAKNAIEGLALIHKLKPQIAFIDIQMPKISGLELASMIDSELNIKIVFVTAFDQFAVTAFDKEAFDYLLKPVELPRLRKTIERYQHTLTSDIPQPVPTAALTMIPCTGNQRIRLIKPEQIEVVYSDHSGVHINTSEGELNSHLTLKTLEEKTCLQRCHRQYLVNPSNINEICLLEGGLAKIITTSGWEAQVSRRYLKEIKLYLGLQ